MNTALAPMQSLRVDLDRMADQFHAALPAHIPVKRFVRTVLTALQNDPDLTKCDRKSLWNACMRAAQDGLLPDGREGAIVAFRDKSGHQIAQWMPMIGGLRKKAQNSGEIISWDVQAVFENDDFDYELGDQPFIHHKPTLAAERGPLIAVYSIVALKGGDKSREVMSVHEVEEIRKKSRAKGGPWSDPTFYPEMAKKTVARRHAKRLPMSSDLDDFIRRDDHLYEVGDAPPRPKLTDFTDEVKGDPDYAGAHLLGYEARNAGKVIDPPSNVFEELHDAYRAGWTARDDELKGSPNVETN